MKKPELVGLHYYVPTPRAQPPQTRQADLCIYGGTSAGLAAAVQARRMGLSVVVVEFSNHLGGLSAGGLGATDIGAKAAIGGISRSFYQALGKHYGNPENWTFEPHAAAAVFDQWVAEHDIPVFRLQRLTKVASKAGRITHIEMEDGNVYRAAAYIDATYEGDLMALAGVAYTVGREPNSQYRETLSGVHFGHPNHNFRAFVDPYRIPGKKSSGLLPGVLDADPGFQGQGDRCVQAYNFRMCLTNVPRLRMPFPKPRSYNPARYELLRRYIHAGVWDALRLTKMMPNGKTDTNNFGGFSTDHINANWDYPDAHYPRREEIFQDHVNYQLGLMHFLTHDKDLPAHVRKDARQWGLCKDEFTATGGWPHQLYVREARRMVSDVVMTEHHCVHRDRVPDSVGLAAYQMDSHNCRRIVLDGRAINEGNVEVRPTAPYAISYRAIVPSPNQCSNLLVPVCLSSSHIAYGSIRMEPVFMILGQSAATAAALAIDADLPVQAVDYRRLRRRLLKDRQVLEWKKSMAPDAKQNP